MTLLATGAARCSRGILRIGATVAGALLGFIVARWLPYDHVALALFLAGITMLGMVGMVVSPHGLAWLLITITSTSCC